MAVLAARGLIGGPVVTTALRTVRGVLRPVPGIAWARVFVVAVGLGPFARMLAIMVKELGFYGRFFADDMEDVDNGPVGALTATGARKIDVLTDTCGNALVHLDLAICSTEGSASSTILGRCGGIGIELKIGFDLFDYSTVMTAILMMAVVMIAVEQLGI